MIARLAGVLGAVGMALVAAAAQAETNDRLMADLRKRFAAYTGPMTNKGEVR